MDTSIGAILPLRRCFMEYAPRRKLTREFKLEAVRQAAMSEKPKAQLARELGVRVGQLRTWRLVSRDSRAPSLAFERGSSPAWWSLHPQMGPRIFAYASPSY